MTWHEAAAYANALSTAAGSVECYRCSSESGDLACEVAVNPHDCAGYRLPTEAEWEGAARCGTDHRYAGSDDHLLVAWTADNSASTTRATARLAPNSCGTYDMSGNVFEWTQDWYGAYSTVPTTDPTGPVSGTLRVGRGGDYHNATIAARSTFRFHNYPTSPSVNQGFRLARSAP